MAHTIAIPRPTHAAVQANAVPWHIWACVLAVTSASFGGVWDISWHESIGRDTFWTAPHLFIHFGGILAGFAAIYLIMVSTFGSAAERRMGTVQIWGFRGPLGAFICCWGGVAMVTSAPFDNWWHSAYGLDVKILSPPHVILILGMLAIRMGAVVLILGEMNRAEGVLRTKLEVLLLYTYTFILGVAVGIFQEYTFTDSMHSALFYVLMSFFTPLFLIGIAEVSSFRWPCTTVAGIFTALHLMFLWLLPLFPAEPKLGPVYQHVTHLIPPPFPLLIIVPAVALDLLRPRLKAWNPVMRAAAFGAVFLTVFLAVQWPFADFLQSPASHNWIFGTQYFPYFLPPTDEWVRGVYSQIESSPAEFREWVVGALGMAMLSSGGGLLFGGWMRRVRR